MVLFLLFLLAASAIELRVSDNTPRAYHVPIDRDIQKVTLCAHATLSQIYACDDSDILTKVLYRRPAQQPKIVAPKVIHMRDDEIRIPKDVMDAFTPPSARGTLVYVEFVDQTTKSLWLPRARTVKISAPAPPPAYWMPWQYTLLTICGLCAAAAVGAVLLLTRRKPAPVPHVLSGYDFDMHRPINDYKKLAVKLGLHYE